VISILVGNANPVVADVHYAPARLIFRFSVDRLVGSEINCHIA